MNKFEESLLAQYGKEDFDKVRSVKVGIAGCGGLGSNCACNLVRSGFKKFKIVDFDKIDHSNLNRQFYFNEQVGLDKVKALEVNLKKINVELDIETSDIRLDGGNIEDAFNDCDIVVEAFDAAECKKMLIEKLLPTGKFIVSASGLVGYGKSDDIKVHKIKDNLVLVGDLNSDSKDSAPISPRVNVAAAKQADIVLEHVILGRSEI